MLHDNLITENFLHHVQKEQSISPPQSQGSPSKMNFYSQFHYKQMQHQLLHQQQQQHHTKRMQPMGDEVLDLSRRCGSVETPPRKTPSPTNGFHALSSVSPNTNYNNEEQHQHLPCISPIQRPEISASLLAENLQKFYNHQQNLLTTPPVGLLNASQPVIPAIYPMFYPQIKQEPVDTDLSADSPTYLQQHQHNNVRHAVQQQQQPSIQNLFSASEHLLKAAAAVATNPPSSYPKSAQTSAFLPSISPKIAVKADLAVDVDRMSNVSSIPGSPSSSTSIVYPKLLNTSNTTAALPNGSCDASSTAPNKPTRPFKAFPRDPLVIAANFAATDVLYDNPRVERYTEYRKRVLEQIRTANGGERTVSNPKMRRLNTRNNFSNTNVSSDGSYSDSQANNSEAEERANDSSSDNDTIVQSTTGYENVGSNHKHKHHHNNNNSESNKNKNETDSSGNSLVKDSAYYERRRKNNAAAKKSRDRRRIKEDEIAIRAAYLERQNIELLCQLDALKAQLAALTKAQAN